MEVTSVPQNHLGRIPEELLVGVINQPCLSDIDLISFALTNRHHYRVAISPAYKAHVEQSRGLAIYWAIENDRQETLERLFENGLNHDVDSGTCSVDPELDEQRLQVMIHGLWATPLAWAVIHGRDSMVEYLLDKGASLEGMTFGLCECRTRMLQCCSVNVGVVAPRLDQDSLYPRDDWSPLHYAICKGNASTAQLLLARGANAGDIGGGVPALFVAARFGMDEIVDYLIANSAANVNATLRDGMTALHVAFVARQFDMVDKLLKQGAYINASYHEENGPWTIFLMACADGFFHLARRYLRKGADTRLIIENPGPDHLDQYTALRLIWQHDMDTHRIGPGWLDEAMELEEAIIARGKADPSSGEESD